MASINDGLNSWQQSENHNEMIRVQRDRPETEPAQGVEIAYMAGSAFRITSPGGISMIVDPWRNHPSGKWDWYYYDFPLTECDIGISTHAHFDHDALHLLKSHMSLDRMIGTFAFHDVTITGLADKHATDGSQSLYDWPALTHRLTGVDVRPPNNPRSFDNVLMLIETGGLRILHWGDNRADPDPHVWEALGEVDIVLLPVEESRHILTYEAADRIAGRLGAKVIIPHHYFIWDIVTRGSTLMPATEWVESHERFVHVDGPARVFTDQDVKTLQPTVFHFGDHVAFERPRPKWLDGIPDEGEAAD